MCSFDIAHFEFFIEILSCRWSTLHCQFSSQGSERTSWERPKSALYLRLKQRKVFEIAKGDPLGFLKLQFVSKYEKMEGGPFGDNVTVPKSVKRGLLGFLNP